MKWLFLLCLLLGGCSSKNVSAKQFNELMNDRLFEQKDGLEQWGVTLSTQKKISRKEACRMMKEAYGDNSVDCVEAGWLKTTRGDLTLQEIDPALNKLIYSMDHPHYETFFEFEDSMNEENSGSMHRFDSLRMQTQFDVDWTKVKVEALQPSSTFFQPVALQERTVSFVPLLSSQQFEYKGYRVSWNVSAAGIHVHASRQTPLQLRTQLAFDLNRLTPVVQWIEDKKRFQLDFDMNQKIGIHKAMMNTLSSDFSKLDPHQLLTTLKNSFHNGPTLPETVIPIARIRIPVPEIPMMDLGLVLSLHCYSGGKAELVLSQQGSVGMEIRNGTVRMIHEVVHDEQAQIQGSSSLTATLKAMVNLAGVSLMDVSGQTGIRGVVRTTGWIDEDGELVQKELGQLPVNEQPVHPKLKFCSDINVHGILNLSCNSDNSVAGRLGFDRRLELIDERNGTINPHGLTHIENGMFVKECTRKRKKPQQTAIPTVDITDTIRLKESQFLLDPDQKASIQVIGVVQGMTLADLVYTVRDPRIATVLQNGVIQAVRPGNTIVTVSDPSGKHQAFVHVHVREKK